MKPAERFLSAHVKAVSKPGEVANDAPYGWVEGCINAFEVDRYGDLVLPSAIAAAIPKYMTNPVLSFGHGIDGNPANGTMPAGSTLSIVQDLQGNSHFRARFANTPDAQQARQLYADGDMRAFSIHFLPYGPSLETRNPTQEEIDRFPGVQRVITKLELIEIALAVVPVNAGSLSTGAKSFTGSKPLSALPLLKRGAKAMKTVLSSDQRKAVEGAAGAYEKHVKSLEGVKGALEELSESQEGSEADHPAMSAKVMKAMESATASHQALADAVGQAHKAITLTTDDPAGDGAADSDDSEDGSAPVADPEAKAMLSAFEKAFK